MKEDYVKRVITAVEKDLLHSEDGFLVWWPEGHPKGFFNSASLRVIADELDKRNKPWEEELEQYLAQGGGH